MSRGLWITAPDAERLLEAISWCEGEGQCMVIGDRAEDRADGYVAANLAHDELRGRLEVLVAAAGPRLLKLEGKRDGES